MCHPLNNTSTPFQSLYLTTPNSTPMTPYSEPLRLPSALAVLSLPWTATPTGAMPGGYSSVSFSRAYALPSTNGRDHGDVVTGRRSVSVLWSILPKVLSLVL
jgi:hypothetical protein